MPARRHCWPSFGTSRDRLLGAGGESEVFALDEERVLRLYRAGTRRPSRRSASFGALYAVLGAQPTSASRCR